MNPSRLCRRRGLFLVPLLGLVAACTRPPAPPEELRAVRTVVVQPGAVAAQSTFAGEVRPRYESSLGFRVAGKIESRRVNVGDRVARGDVLMRLDARDLALGEASSRAAVVAQEAQFAVEKADFERYAKLASTGFISAAEYDRQKTRYEAAQAQLESVRAQARVTGNQTGYAELRADADGTITAVEAEAGQVVASGQTVVRLARSGAMEVASAVPELLAPRLAVGQPVEVMLWTSGPTVYPGRVRELAASADAATRTFALRVSVDQPPPAMQLGMTASLRIVDSSVPALIHLPLSAYIESAGQQGVWVYDESAGAVAFRPVALVGFERNVALIGGGLKPGERVVTAGASLLRPGQKVRLLADPAPAASPPAAPAASAG